LLFPIFQDWSQDGKNQLLLEDMLLVININAKIMLLIKKVNVKLYLHLKMEAL